MLCCCGILPHVRRLTSQSRYRTNPVSVSSTATPCRCMPCNDNMIHVQPRYAPMPHLPAPSVQNHSPSFRIQHAGTTRPETHVQRAVPATPYRSPVRTTSHQPIHARYRTGRIRASATPPLLVRSYVDRTPPTSRRRPASRLSRRASCGQLLCFLSGRPSGSRGRGVSHDEL